MVFKSFFVKGKTEPDGSIALNISKQDCNLGIGQWRLCISSLVLKLDSALDSAVSVSTSLGFQHFPTTHISEHKDKDKDRRASVFQSGCYPVRLSVLALKGDAGETIQAIREGNAWIHFESPMNPVIKFFFLEEDAKKETPLKAFVLASVRLERTS